VRAVAAITRWMARAGSRQYDARASNPD